jgi:hypothetical protein
VETNSLHDVAFSVPLQCLRRFARKIFWKFATVALACTPSRGMSDRTSVTRMDIMRAKKLR